MTEQVDLENYLKEIGGEDSTGQKHSSPKEPAPAQKAAGKIETESREEPPPDPGDPLSRVESVATLEEWQKACRECNRCELRRSAKGVVFGEGNPQADILFVGEGPGGDEDRLGRPFVGRAGQLLDRILHAAGFAREDVFIANIVKCRPPSNRTPAREEIEACYPLLEKQIQLIDPPILVCLGSVAAKELIHPRLAITRERGRWHKLGGRDVMPTFHPAALLRDPRKKKPVWEDMQQVVALYHRLKQL